MRSPALIMKESNLRPKKGMGQNFLSDKNMVEKIVSRSKIMADDIVLEIGSGLGALTVPVARISRKVYTVEKDRQLIPLLNTMFTEKSLENIILIEKSILDVDIDEIAVKEGCKIVVIGNLPYNISSQILVRLINSRHLVKSSTLMFQKELAERICSGPGSKDYGRLSVMLQYCADIKNIANVQAKHFYPKPKVDSSVIKIDFKDEPEFPVTDEKFFFKVIKAGFGKRRKILKNALMGSELHIDAQIATEVLTDSGIDLKRRAETLSVEEFSRLSNKLWNKIKVG
ncbi:MAG: ribosomal RNA small subunit methyltransferase A [Desulfobacterales bacterium]|nr:ribosomal RNA small subunit methyltransferase A [Desulfobacterales bacterium]